ncbi:methionine sulfoxide reductase B [Haematobacter missouriensis]|uniref:peptide-methionine (R)-S-oxide reductase n=1 Tax=Haematobacter missouriensis TaxID=366616 RepID=A0A212AVQ3_9RHOB|nr:peptide-methionine (R)-S-oxide reductase MsrB [Haematobacter missouriensis]KFI33621.1 methionine sulfoxide reductase B [Haematobacter missouriensis]OWJ79286.1 peptide-methionine (R)-S-oxide reductase [Haematobacter missouriensis]OWJ85558.1 peptide-methionine (R)-S-oxide reductase [Haematobacter missouriensis]
MTDTKQKTLPVQKTEAEWREQLSDLAYRVTREQATERPFSHDDFPQGAAIYRCVGCGTELFDQAEKFDSHCGWPAFTAPTEGAPVGESVDRSHGMVRVEVHCDNCGAHLGHVFPDGPGPTGLRYCINGVALVHEPKG